GFHRLQGLAIDASGALVAPNLLPGPSQYVWPRNPIEQGMEPPIAVSLRCQVERPLECTGFVDRVVGLGHALTRPFAADASPKCGPFPPAELCCPGRHTSYG